MTTKKETVQRAYSGRGKDYDTIRSDDAGIRLSDYDLSIVNRMNPFLSGENATNLEVGCGTGRFTVPMLKMGYQVTATDINESLIASLREKVAEAEDLQSKCTIQIENGFELSFEDNSIDGLFSIHVIGRFESDSDQLELLKEFSRVLKPGGKLLFNFSNKTSLLYGKMSHKHLISFKRVSDELSALGFEVIDQRGKWVINGTLLRKIPSFLRSPILLVDKLMQTFWISRSWDIFILAKKK